MKGSTRIVGAFVLGVVVITAAFFLRGGGETTAAGNLAIITENLAVRPEARDGDGNGIEDWREELEKSVVKEITPTFASTSPNEEYEEPTTFTDKFARSFFQSFMEGKMMGQTPEDKTALIEEAIESVAKNTSQKIFTEKDINTAETNGTSLREYGNMVGEVLSRAVVSQTEPMAILQEILDTQDETKMGVFKIQKETYARILKMMLIVPTPRTLSTQHLELVNSIEALRMDFEAMEVALTDPLYTLARVKRYEEDQTFFMASLQNIQKNLSAEGIVYSNDEYGAALNLLTP